MQILVNFDNGGTCIHRCLLDVICWSILNLYWHMSHDMTKPTKWVCAQRRLQVSLGIRPVWSASSLCAQRVAKDPSFLHADSEDSDQIGRMPRLIWVFARRTAILLVLSCRGSYWPIWGCKQNCQIAYGFEEKWYNLSGRSNFWIV